MGLTVRQQLYASGDYRNGLATTLAGGNLPDTIYNQSTNVIANLPQFLQTQCALRARRARLRNQRAHA